ncbi:MAG: bifunctional glutamate N-acetyltransferase/amino-acid acetyltransferase ArgJ [Treponema sp.]|nr:bifunctional glutamate N-acetyltransferase/amino-acid acetyltransferase ArgJ [Treponema sp.]
MQEITFVSGGVTAPRGFTANGVLCGIKKGRTAPDLALIFSEKRCTATAVYTQNRVQAACIALTKAHLANGMAQAVVANSGNANACTGEQGAENARRMAAATANALDIPVQEVAVCSTGVIGQQLPVEKIESHMQQLISGLSKENHVRAREAIMTTDTRYKECAVQFLLSGKPVTIGAMCKGSGMIHINMGTMLAFVTTDCAISRAMLDKALRESVEATYNCVSIDGDTSTNDTLLLFANGMAGNTEINCEGADYDAFLFALNTLNTIMAKKIAADGEGASRLVACTVSGAQNVKSARALAKAVISSNLVKAAMFGSDANWGRVLCALGYSGIPFVSETASVAFASEQDDEMRGNVTQDDEAAAREKNCYTEKQRERVAQSATCERHCNVENATCATRVVVFENGVPLDFDEALAKKILSSSAVHILVSLQDGNASGTAWGCDLTYDYVKINGDYRT